MAVLLGFVLVIWFISAVVMVTSILFHSSKGTGLSDMIAGQVYNTSVGTGLIEKNLDRITIVSAVLFFVTIIILMLIYPQGGIGGQ
ncbi:MAG: preprotein translocase subunit SecG [Coriobacteriia bacterium]|nr:preprotein translocase subunit SecG [Coriobacteriia bacterium]MDR2714968.1 preprotein translocase subunit SecG [Coriobacteriales bacterium]